MAVSVVFYASNMGGSETRVLARFITDESGLHSERFDRATGQWIHDGLVAGFLTGHDDWAEEIKRDVAGRLLESWGSSASLLDAPVVAGATT